MKRQADEAVQELQQARKKHNANGVNAKEDFRPGLFDAAVLADYANKYSASAPYKHAVIHELVNDDLLRSVRSEILENIHFTPKETDIYKIHQSGDLANLDGLPASALEKLPSLLKLRDALYSYEFRQWVSIVSGAGALSGQKTDMAVNVYVPGCHLLCHDDVIGSRRVSYILYLTSPETPWESQWGGALRLYPTDQVQSGDGEAALLPRVEWTKVIPPAWNQLSFFAVQPGESFHDVEEVYHRAAGADGNDGGRMRMAISGWFHIPQEGEEGFELGLEEKLAEKSSLQQLQGKAEELDEPRDQWIAFGDQPDTQTDEDVSGGLTEDDLQFLIGFMTPNYLTPDTVEELNEIFTEESVLQLTNFLSDRFSATLKSWLESVDSTDIHQFRTSRPPHKHRYQYLQSRTGDFDSSNATKSPIRQVLDGLLPSVPFQKWLSLVTGLTLRRCSAIARRFRRGLDYQLAQSYEGEDPQLEYTLCVTPTLGWVAEEEGEDGEGESSSANRKTNGTSQSAAQTDQDNPGGYELYMAGDDFDADEKASDDGVAIPASVQSQTGAGQRRSAKSKKADPAVYQAASNDEDDGILFSNPAKWNTMSIVLRDRGTLKFVKYVSQSAPGDRFDFTGCVEVEEDDEEEGGEEDDE